MGHRNHVATLKGVTYTLYCLENTGLEKLGCSDHPGVTYRLVLGTKK